MTARAGCWKTSAIVLSVLVIVVGVSLFVMNPKKATIYQINFQQWNVLVSGNGSGDKGSLNSEGKGNEKKSGSENVCRTPECISLAQKLTNWGDKTADPCTDFYQYTCGRYTEHVNTDSGIGDWKESITANMFTEFLARNKSTNSKSENVLKKLYSYCKEVEDGKLSKEVDEQSLRDLDKDIQKIGEWPMISKNWSEESFVLNEYLGKIAELGLAQFGLFGLAFNSRIRVVPDHKLKKFPGKIEVVKRVLMRLLKLHDIPHSSSIQKDFDDVVALTENVIRITGVERHTQNAVDFSKLSADNPKFDFEKIVVKLQNSTENWDILKRKFVLFPESVFAHPNNALDELIEQTSPRVLANFFAIRSILTAMEIAEANEGYSCASPLFNARLGNQWFVTHHFETENQKLALDLVDRFKEYYLNLFQNSTWLHEMTKKNAAEKLNKMRALVAFSEELAEPGAFDKIVEENLHDLPSDSYYVLRRKLIHFNIKLDLNDTINDGAVFSFAPIINAAYNRQTNLFTLFAPIVSEPLFDATLPQSANIASIGLVVAHEIGHAYDSEGSKIDGDGNLIDWWHPDDMKEFKKSEQCVIDKYENYDDPSYGKNMNGTSTLEENSADIMGLDAAWSVYKQIDVSKEQKIIGFEDYPTDKLFFRINALFWCSLFETNSLTVREMDPHGTSSYRVNGLYSNSEQFGKTFNCPVGSPMNSEKKCKIF